MIRKNTVLVLGAGASVDYGYPTGGELQSQLLETVGALSATANRLTLTLGSMGFDKELITAFRVALAQSSFESIDQLLEHRPDLLDIGKTAIAWNLIQYEEPGRLYSPTGWYKYLFKHLSGNCSFGSFGANRIAFITFNYDRSLEQFLFGSVSKGYGKGMEETAKVLSSIPIVHLHGSLGALPWQDKNGRDYTSVLSEAHDIRSISRSIKVIHEGSSVDDSDFRLAQDLIGKAAQLIFLGFGYHDTNLERLLHGITLQPDCRMCGSFLGFTGREMRRVVGKIKDMTHIDFVNDEAILGMNIVGFLRHAVDLD